LTLSARPVRFGLFQRCALLRQFRTAREILFAIEINIAIDERRIDARVNTERMCIPNRDIGVFSDFDRPDAILNAELNRRI
jgi:hypothetical protein